MGTARQICLPVLFLMILPVLAGCASHCDRQVDPAVIAAASKVLLEAAAARPRANPYAAPDADIMLALLAAATDRPDDSPIKQLLTLRGDGFEIVMLEHRGAYLISDAGDIIVILPEWKMRMEEAKVETLETMAAAAAPTCDARFGGEFVREIDRRFGAMLLEEQVIGTFPARLAKEFKAERDGLHRENLLRVIKSVLANPLKLVECRPGQPAQILEIRLDAKDHEILRSVSQDPTADFDIRQ